MKIFTNGTYDVLTVAHINLLLFCRQIAGVNGTVIVSLDSDKKITIDKGINRPIFKFSERHDAISSITCYGNQVVSAIDSHDDNNLLEERISIMKPDYIVVGSDYKDKYVVGSEHAKVIFFERDKRFSSTKIIEACRRQHYKN